MCESCEAANPVQTVVTDAIWAETLKRLRNLTAAHRVSARLDAGPGVCADSEMLALATMIRHDAPSGSWPYMLAMAIDLLARVQWAYPEELAEIQHPPYIRLLDRDDDQPPVPQEVMTSAKILRAAIEGGAGTVKIEELAQEKMTHMIASAISRVAEASNGVMDINVLSVAAGQIFTSALMMLAERLTDQDLYVS